MLPAPFPVTIRHIATCLGSMRRTQGVASGNRVCPGPGRPFQAACFHGLPDPAPRAVEWLLQRASYGVGTDEIVYRDPTPASGGCCSSACCLGSFAAQAAAHHSPLLLFLFPLCALPCFEAVDQEMALLLRLTAVRLDMLIYLLAAMLGQSSSRRG
ncbi:uncharacterized protein BKA78DRAFT_31763 [Phyllosticta capitalensis]|uniref:uncharacterized protein n=1 Tax=Phyllosticta capitalensis TaxID=121624 RepID=UPI0031316E32